MEKSIDKDIETLKKRETMSLNQIIRTFKREGIENFAVVKLESLDNVLSEIDRLNYKLKEKICFEGHSQFKELEKELETYKKIVEKLAEQLQEISNYEYDGEGEYYCEAIYGHCKKTEEPFYRGEKCKNCLIDWARKEVEKDV